jgi:iron complex transport system substrate-binding protein
MKTKNKLLALVEIAIVLCSVLLAAMSAIATEQTTQKASGSTITTASEDDFVLDIYGNANEDDTIDMRDLTYVKLIFFGKKPGTELADAKYDGKINPLDFIQIKLIIVGKEKELTIVAPVDPLTPKPPKVITISKPVERIVVLMAPEAEVLRSIGASDKVVGVGTYINDAVMFFPELSKLPSVGSHMSVDYEAVLRLDPDLFMVFAKEYDVPDEEKLPGVTVIAMNLRYPEGYTERGRLLGYIIDKEEEAEEYIKWHEGLINNIKSRTERLSEDEKPRVFHWVFFRPGGVYRIDLENNRMRRMGDIAGGRSIAEGEGLSGTWATVVDSEWVIVQNPDIIVAQTFIGGYGTDNPSEIAVAREGILNRPELAEVTAVKTGNVYMMAALDLATAGSGCLLGTAYLAKWFHPELFADLDPKAIHQEYIDRFQRIDYDLDEHGVLVYPPLED